MSSPETDRKHQIGARDVLRPLMLHGRKAADVVVAQDHIERDPVGSTHPYVCQQLRRQTKMKVIRVFTAIPAAGAVPNAPQERGLQRSRA